MDLQTIISIGLGIIYVIYSGSKSRQKHEENRPGQNDRRQQRKTLEEQFRELIDPPAAPPRTIRPEHRESEPVKVSPPPKPVPRTFLEGESIENALITEAQQSLSSARTDHLEDDREPLAEKIEQKYSARKHTSSLFAKEIVGQGFDARKAFIYSEIFNRKYR